MELLPKFGFLIKESIVPVISTDIPTWVCFLLKILLLKIHFCYGFQCGFQNRKIFSQYSWLSFSAVYRQKTCRFAFHLLDLILHKIAAENMGLHELENFRWLGPTWKLISSSNVCASFGWICAKHESKRQMAWRSINPSRIWIDKKTKQADMLPNFFRSVG